MCGETSDWNIPVRFMPTQINHWWLMPKCWPESSSMSVLLLCVLLPTIWNQQIVHSHRWVYVTLSYSGSADIFCKFVKRWVHSQSHWWDSVVWTWTLQSEFLGFIHIHSLGLLRPKGRGVVHLFFDRAPVAVFVFYCLPYIPLNFRSICTITVKYLYI